jgi:hypothetical protein
VSDEYFRRIFNQAPINKELLLNSLNRLRIIDDSKYEFSEVLERGRQITSSFSNVLEIEDYIRFMGICNILYNENNDDRIRVNLAYVLQEINERTPRYLESSQQLRDTIRKSMECKSASKTLTESDNSFEEEPLVLQDEFTAMTLQEDTSSEHLSSERQKRGVYSLSLKPESLKPDNFFYYAKLLSGTVKSVRVNVNFAKFTKRHVSDLCQALLEINAHKDIELLELYELTSVKFNILRETLEKIIKSRSEKGEPLMIVAMTTSTSQKAHFSVFRNLTHK